MSKYNSLGLSMNKYNQALLFAFSLLLIAVNYMLGSSLLFWAFFIGMLLVINFIWYWFSDVKWNNEFFIIEKFLQRKEITADKFVRIDRVFFNVFVIKFTDNQFYYTGDVKSIFESPFDITQT